MGRTVRGGSRNHTPNVRPVQKVELSEKNTRQRFIAVIVLLVIASGAFMYALNGLMSNDSGWTNIEVGSSAEIHCGDDYIFRYYVGAAGVNATAEKKALTLLYTDSIVKECETGSEGGAFGEKYKTEIYRSDRIAGHCFRRIYVCTEWIDVK